MRKGLFAFKLVPQRRKHHSVHKKPLSHDAQNPLSQHAQKKEVTMLTRWAMSSKTWTVCSKFVPSAPILKHELQLSTVSSNSQPCALANLLPNSQKPPNWTELSKTSRGNIQIHLSFVIIYYYMFFLFFLYIILYYMYFIFIICYFILYKLP